MPELPRLTVALTFDHDSISDGVRRGYGGPPSIASTRLERRSRETRHRRVGKACDEAEETLRYRLRVLSRR